MPAAIRYSGMLTLESHPSRVSLTISHLSLVVSAEDAHRAEVADNLDFFGSFPAG